MEYNGTLLDCHLQALLLEWINFNPNTDKYIYIPHIVSDKITYLLPKFNGTAIEVWEWISYFITHFTIHVIVYLSWDLSYSMLVKGTLDSI